MFDTAPLALGEGSVIIAIGVALFLVLEAEKSIVHHFSPKAG